MSKYTDQPIWKNDFVTRAYIREHIDTLNVPSRMTISALARTCTYCNSWENPYSREIMKRSGHLAKFDECRKGDTEARRDIFNKACNHYNIKMY